MIEPPGSVVLARLPTDAATARRLADMLAETLDPETAAVAAYGDVDAWAVEICFTIAPSEDLVRALVGDLAGEEAARRLVFTTVGPRDWVGQSLDRLRPVMVGRFFVHGAHDRRLLPANRIGIEIEAALAFGTGHHGTTRGCLKALDRLLKTGRFRNILDLGTGSGVLAIAAARATRRHVVASDIDPASVRLAGDNARLNRVAAHLRIVRADGLGDRRLRSGAPFDLVFANILLGTLERLAQPIGSCAAPGTRLVLSGLLPNQANAVIAPYRYANFVLERRILLDGWATLVLCRPDRPPHRSVPSGNRR
jgi:ribosomal protein L11 methyltransferase